MAQFDAPNDIYYNGVQYNRAGSQVSGLNELVFVTNPKVMVNADVIFTAFGDVQILDIVSECITANDATASTLQYQIVPTVGTATTITGASATLANATAATLVTPVLDALATAPVISTTGVGLGSSNARGIFFPTGTLKVVIGVGSTTGTWKHYIRYAPLEAGASIS